MSQEDRAKQKTRRNLISSDLPLNKVVFMLAAPVMAQMLLQTLAQIVDMSMVGKLGSEAIAGIGLSFRPLFVAMSIFLGLGAATTALVARSIGANKEDEARDSATQSIITGTMISFVLAIFTFFAAKQIILFMGAEDGVINNGILYLKGYSPGMFLAFIGLLVTASLRGAGDTKTPFIAGFVENFVNVIGNYILIFGKFGFPAFGVLGAAIATSIARLVSLSIMMYILVKGKAGLHIKLKDFFIIKMSVIKRLFKIGIPAAFERLTQSVALMFTTKIVASLGTTAVAITTLSGNIEQLSFMPAIGFSVAAGTLVGQNLGAKQPSNAEKSGWTAVKMAMLLMGIMGALFILIPEVFIRIYTNEVDVVAGGKLVLRILGLAQVPQAVAFAISGGLRGAGDTKAVLYISSFGNFVIRLGLTWLFINVFHWSLWSVYFVMVFDWFVRGALLALRFRQGSWKNIRV